MTPPIFTTISASAAVKVLLGSSPVRFYPFDLAPQPGTSFYSLPYAVWQIVTGMPENYLGEVPDVDRYTIQIDVYGKTSTEVRSVVEALRDAIEPHAYVTRWGNESTDPETGLNRYGFDVDWHVTR